MRVLGGAKRARQRKKQEKGKRKGDEGLGMQRTGGKVCSAEFELRSGHEAVGAELLRLGVSAWLVAHQLEAIVAIHLGRLYMRVCVCVCVHVCR